MSIHGMSLFVSVDFHKVREGGKPTGDFVTFLNINAKNLAALKGQDTQLNGLLAYDDHSAATVPPQECQELKLRNFHEKKQGEWTSVDTSESESPMFLSDARAMDGQM